MYANVAIAAPFSMARPLAMVSCCNCSPVAAPGHGNMAATVLSPSLDLSAEALLDFRLVGASCSFCGAPRAGWAMAVVTAPARLGASRCVRPASDSGSERVYIAATKRRPVYGHHASSQQLTRVLPCSDLSDFVVGLFDDREDGLPTGN